MVPGYSQGPLDAQKPLEFERLLLSKAMDLIDIRDVVTLKYQEFALAADKNTPAEMSLRLGELRQAVKEASAKIEEANKSNQFPAHFGSSPESETGKYISILAEACDNELMEMLKIREAGANTPEQQARIRSIKGTLEDRLISAIDKFDQALEWSLIRESRSHIKDSAPYCDWLDYVLNDLKNNFKNIKSNPHSSMAKTWDCKRVFPDAEQTYCKELSGSSVEAIYISGNDFDAFAKIQRELYYQLAGCDHKGCYHDLFTDVQGTRKYAKTKAEVDAGGVSYYEFWTGDHYAKRHWSCKINLSKTGGEYTITVSVEKVGDE